jgi:IS5 family transposase
MIIDRYDPINLFELVPKLNLRFEPELAQLDGLLDDDELFERVKADLVRRHPNSGRLGRRSTPVEVILRMLVVKQLYGWSYEQTEHFVGDSIVLRQFTRLYLERVPDDTTLIRWANTRSVLRRLRLLTNVPSSWLIL